MWTKIDDGFRQNPKIIAAGAEGLALDVCAWTFASQYGTDGFVPDACIPGLYPPLAHKARQLAQRLVELGRWERDDERGGYWIHDYLIYNPAAEQRELEARERSERARAAARARWDAKRNASRNAPSNAGGTAPSNATSNAESMPPARARVAGARVAHAEPVPSRPVSTSPPSTHVGGDAPLPAGGAAGEEDVLTQDEKLELCWRSLAEADLRRYLDDGGEIRRSKQAWLAKAAAKREEALNERALGALARWHDLTPAELAAWLETGHLPRRHDAAFRRPDVAEPMPEDAFKTGAASARAALRGGQS